VEVAGIEPASGSKATRASTGIVPAFFFTARPLRDKMPRCYLLSISPGLKKESSSSRVACSMTPTLFRKRRKGERSRLIKQLEVLSYRWQLFAVPCFYQAMVLDPLLLPLLPPSNPFHPQGCFSNSNSAHIILEDLNILYLECFSLKSLSISRLASLSAMACLLS
jgi:hypothetical protein